MSLLNDTIGGFLDKISVLYPENEALVSNEKNLRLNYSEFNQLCRTVAKGFMAMGIKKGDHIAIWATNYPEWVLAQFATAKMGAVLVTVNTNYKIFELEVLNMLKLDNYSEYISLEWVKRWNNDLEAPAIAFPHFINYVKKYI